MASVLSLLRRLSTVAPESSAVLEALPQAAQGRPAAAQTVYAPHAWRVPTQRCGALGIKLGMMSYWDSWGKRHPVTVVHLADCTALESHPSGQGSHWVQEVGIGKKSAKKAHIAQLRLFARCAVAPKARIDGFLVNAEEALLPPGTPIRAAHFLPGQFVNVQGRSIGKGFQGVMRRWNFDGQPASHGTSLTHRKPGCIGSREDPSTVAKGKKMPGRMGGKNATMLSLQVMKVDNAANCILVKGSVPGPDRTILRIRDANTPANRALFRTARRNANLMASSGKAMQLPLLPFPTIPDAVIATMPREMAASAGTRDAVAIVDRTESNAAAREAKKPPAAKARK